MITKEASATNIKKQANAVRDFPINCGPNAAKMQTENAIMEQKVEDEFWNSIMGEEEELAIICDQVVEASPKFHKPRHVYAVRDFPLGCGPNHAKTMSTTTTNQEGSEEELILVDDKHEQMETNVWNMSSEDMDQFILKGPNWSSFDFDSNVEDPILKFCDDDDEEEQGNHSGKECSLNGLEAKVVINNNNNSLILKRRKTSAIRSFPQGCERKPKVHLRSRNSKGKKSSCEGKEEEEWSRGNKTGRRSIVLALMAAPNSPWVKGKTGFKSRKK